MTSYMIEVALFTVTRTDRRSVTSNIIGRQYNTSPSLTDRFQTVVDTGWQFAIMSDINMRSIYMSRPSCPSPPSVTRSVHSTYHMSSAPSFCNWQNVFTEALIKAPWNVYIKETRERNDIPIYRGVDLICLEIKLYSSLSKRYNTTKNIIKEDRI